MLIPVKFFKVLGLPSEPAANAVYFVFDEDNEVVTTWVTDQDGQAFAGAEGRSAYQIAIDNGFEGTEVAWLESLVGPPGPPALEKTQTAVLEADFPKTNDTFSSVSFDKDLQVEAGHIYRLEAAFPITVGAGGAKVGLTGGTALFASGSQVNGWFIEAGVPYALRTTIAGSFEGGSTGTNMLYITALFAVNGSGTFIPQFAQMEPSGTSTMKKYAAMTLTDITPQS